jgi:MFS family permease
MLIGPLIGGYSVENYGWNFHFYLVAGLALVCLILSLALKEKNDEESIDQKISGNDLENKPQEPVFNRKIISILIIYILYCIAIGSATTTTSRLLPIHLTEKFKVDKIQLSLFFSAGTGLATLLPQIPAGILADRIGRRKLMLYCFSTLPILSLLFLRLDSYIQFLLLFFVINVLWGATWPSSEAYMMNLLPTRVGIGMSIRNAAMSTGRFVGPLVGGYLWQVVNPSAIFSASAVFYLIAFICIFLLPRSRK